MRIRAALIGIFGALLAMSARAEFASGPTEVRPLPVGTRAPLSRG